MGRLAEMLPLNRHRPRRKPPERSPDCLCLPAECLLRRKPMQFAKRLLAISWLIALALVAVVPAGDKGPGGKELYKQNCRVCHEKASPNGEYSPLTLIQDQWKNFFANKFQSTHQSAVLPGQNKKLLE